MSAIEHPAVARAGRHRGAGLAPVDAADGIVDLDRAGRRCSTPSTSPRLGHGGQQRGRDHPAARRGRRGGAASRARTRSSTPTPCRRLPGSTSRRCGHRSMRPVASRPTSSADRRASARSSCGDGVALVARHSAEARSATGGAGPRTSPASSAMALPSASTAATAGPRRSSGSPRSGTACWTELRRRVPMASSETATVDGDRRHKVAGIGASCASRGSRARRCCSCSIEAGVCASAASSCAVGCAAVRPHVLAAMGVAATSPAARSGCRSVVTTTAEDDRHGRCASLPVAAAPPTEAEPAREGPRRHVRRGRLVGGGRAAPGEAGHEVAGVTHEAVGW